MKNIQNSKLHTNIYEQEGVYGDENKFLFSNRLEKILKIVRSLDEKPKRILDVGCGTGYLMHKITFIYPKADIYGIDISKKALSLGQKKYNKIKFVFTDAEKKFPFKDKYFDLVISGEHIEHLKDVDIYLSQINRVMKSNGTLLITTPNLASWINRAFLLFGRQPWYLDPSLRITLPIFSVFGYHFPENLSSLPAGHLRLYTLDMLKKLLKAYGFITKKSYGGWMLSKPWLKQIDMMFSHFPSLAFGLILVAKKEKI